MTTNLGMNEEHLLNPDELETPRPAPAPAAGQPNHTRYRNGTNPVYGHSQPDRSSPPQDPQPAKPRRFDVDPGSFIEVLIRRWYVMFFGASIMLALGVLIGLNLWSGNYSGTAQLMRNDPSTLSDIFRPQELTTATLVAMIQSPEVLQKTGARLNPRLTGVQVKSRITIEPERSTDITNITASAADRKSAVELANAFCTEAVLYTQQVQRQEASGASMYVSRQLTEAGNDLVALRRSMPAAISAAVPSARVTDKLQLARDELTTLLVRYTDAHPLVREARARVAILEEQVTASATAAAALPLGRSGDNRTGSSPGTSTQDYEIALNQLRTLEANHAALITRDRVIRLVETTPPGYFRLLLPASVDETQGHRPWLKIGALSVFFCALGLTVALGEILAREFLDNRVKTPADVKRITQLPLIATLGNLKRMSTDEQNTWSFRTWIALQSRLNRSASRGLICGITSSHHGDGRSTWIRLLAHAASQCGFRVLTITTCPASTQPKNAPPAETVSRPAQESTTLTTNVLTTPGQVAEKLKGPDPQPMVHIPLPGWVWSLERRKQWHSALDLWRKIDNIVILVELPPASVPEAVLLAENIPNLIWLTQSGRTDAMETRTQLETLRQARGNLVGAVLNRAPGSLFERRFARWFGCWTLLAVAAFSSPGLLAQNAPPYTNIKNAPPASNVTPAYTPPPPPTAGTPAPEAPPVSFSVGSTKQRAPWQQRLTLGPGDLLTLGLFGAPELIREEVPISPDGKISFLEAQNVTAAGLTIDELRDRLAEELGKFRRSAQPIVQPFAYRSKKYFVLGKVVQKGVFTLDRPVTIIEAVARARGLETGLADRNLVELADLSRSFLARRGNRQPVNLEKLFLEGDLTQNIPLEPDDYLYFPASDIKEIYVLGEVLQPGASVFNEGTGALAAIAGRGGFTERAWKKRLLVIRGSLNKPETFVVNASDVLVAKSADFKLQPKDIVYVSSRPWIRVEELLDLAASAFVEAAAVTWTGVHLYSNQ